MATFSYKASNHSAKTVKGIIEADNEQMAINILYAKNLIPISIIQNFNTTKKISSENSSTIASLLHTISYYLTLKRVAPTEISSMIRQLSVLLKAGLPLEEALHTLCSYDYSTPLKSCLMQVRDKLLNGNSLAEGLSDFLNIFTPTFISMIKAGEESGTLDIVVEQYADHLEKRIQLVRKIQAALAYPLFMLVIGFAIVIFLLMYVVPEISGMFTGMDRALPTSTQLLLNMSAFFSSWWHLLLVFFICIYFSCYFYMKTEKGQKIWFRILLKAPILAKVYKLILVGQFTRTLGMLLENGVSLLKALNIVRNISQNTYMLTTISDMYEGVQQGHDLSHFMGNPLIFSPIVKQMVNAGEKSGKLPDMLLWIAKDCEDNASNKLQMLTSLLEPIMILVLGLIVGFVVIAIMLPIFEVSNLVA